MAQETSAITVPGNMPEQEPEQIHLVARNPQEMAAAQAHLASWLQRRVDTCDVEVGELAGAVNEARQRNWKSETLLRQHDRSIQRKVFYEKCLLAVQHGFTIIPDIPIDVFAIRTTRTTPRPNEQRTESEYSHVRPDMPDERPQVRPAGEGHYESPSQLVKTTHSSYRDEKGKEIHIRTIKASSFDAVEFPVIAAVPYVMSATQEAIAAKIFDQIGISPQGSVRQADPLIIGQILGESRGYSGRRTASFLIAWHLDLRAL